MLALYETKSEKAKSKSKIWKLPSFCRKKCFGSTAEKFPFGQLPREIQIHILSFLQPSHSRIVSQVCKLWRAHINYIATNRKWTKTPLQIEHSLHTFRFIIVGSGFSGRLSFARRFVDNTFTDKYAPVIEETFRKREEVDGCNVPVELIVTAGQEEYSALRDYYLEQAQGIFIVYCIASKLSFYAAQRMCQAIAFRGLPIIVIGAKLDLQHLREVSSEEGKKLANTYNKNKKNFFEISSKENIWIKEPIHEMIRQVAESSFLLSSDLPRFNCFASKSIPSKQFYSFFKLFQKIH